MQGALYERANDDSSFYSHRVAVLWDVMEKQEKLWPYPAKVTVVVVLFIVFEYILDAFNWLFPGITHGSFTKTISKHRRSHADNDPTLLHRISVLTLNVWVNRARYNLERQLQGVRELFPDVICLQEVFHTDVLEAYRKAFPDYCLVAFGQAHNFSAMAALFLIMLAVAAIFSGAVWLVERFVSDTRWKTVWTIAVPLMMVCYERVVRHHWTIAFLTGNRTGLAMLVRREAVDLHERKCVTFSRAGHAADLLNILRPRGFISAAGVVPMPHGKGSLPVRFVTTHLNQPLEQALGDGRHRQVKEVFAKCIKDDELLIMGCDLNATPPGTINGSDCNTYADVLEEMEDAWVNTNPSDPQRDGLTWDQANNPLCSGLLNKVFYGLETLRWRCDFIFYRFGRRTPVSEDASEHDVKLDSGKPSEFTVDTSECNLAFTANQAVSDHFGVFAVFDIREGVRSKDVISIPVGATELQRKYEQPPECVTAA